MHKEIGGYLELERFTGSMLHEKALALSSGRACLSYLIEQRKIRKIALPDFNCDIVEHPKTLQTEEDEWLYLVNFYGQLSPDELQRIAARVPRLIVDNAQAYFDLPLKAVDTLYTCRTLPADESRERMGFVLGRFERPAGEYFAAAAQNNDDLSMEPKSMSELTKNLLHAVDYDRVKTKRTENFRLLHEGLGSVNCLNLRVTEGAYAYPLMLPEGQKIRKKLIEQKIFVPMLWPNVPEQQPADSEACRLAVQILPLPCDQRYGAEEMAFIIKAVRDCLNP